MKRTGEEVRRQLRLAGLDPYLVTVAYEAAHLHGRVALRAVVALRSHPQFLEGDLHRLHDDVGTPRTEFRSLRGAFGDGSLQVVINTRDGRFYADVDVWNPYQDAVNWVGHAFGEVVPHWWRRLRRG